MNAQPSPPAASPTREAIEALCATVDLPRPPDSLHNVGDGDFDSIGREFVWHLVHRAGLRPRDRVLDIGCGVGRLALPLTAYLAPGPLAYRGFDVSAPAIAWCAATIGAACPGFSFSRLDLRHPLYNPSGAVDPATTDFPAEDGSVDVAAAISVFTHLPPPVIQHYLCEVRRVLAAGGRFFCTAFLLTPAARRQLEAGEGPLPFRAADTGQWQEAYPDYPGAATAVDPAWFEAAAAAAGLRLAAPILPGSWPGAAPGESFQDICLLEAA
ncbi:class I SAM-dependent methyltransferase [Oceanibaculum pacificum]|uniref:Methyltransferase domain-containing protein n=1 Tax=Oceanibaculum pacificum TaxID=580166 RepID=A0A154W2Y9_9PROT|nr:class I SAM-dependent methyltransferase [Oceanibaculum pacificum]KZD07803.1 hypothetical protein AUP43_09745 [Oceanibaculum pacificum]